MRKCAFAIKRKKEFVKKRVYVDSFNFLIAQLPSPILIGQLEPISDILVSLCS